MDSIKKPNQTVTNVTENENKTGDQQIEQQQQQDVKPLQEKGLQQKQDLPEQQQQKLVETKGEENQQATQDLLQASQKKFEGNYDDNDGDDDDDDEGKETSQKLVIDLPDEEENEKGEEEFDDDVIALDDLPQEVHVPAVAAAAKKNEKVAPKPQQEVQAIITLSDGEEDVEIVEASTKPGKIKKRRSMGASSVASSNEDEHYRLKRRKINVAGAPKMPTTGYIRYMNDRKESLRKEHPTKTPLEHNKMIGEEWHALSSDIKSSYLKAADADKQRYVTELHSFLKSRPDILASELAKDKARKPAENNSSNPSATATSTTPLASTKCEMAKCSKDNNNSTKDKMCKDAAPLPSTSQQANEKTVMEKIKRKRSSSPTPPTFTNTTTTTTTTTSTVNATTNASSSAAASNSNALLVATPGEIPIFTTEFLEHNKVYDMELRSLRKSKTDLEQQNSVLEKHVENMKFGVEKMITENNELEEKNRLLEIYLDKLKRKLAVALSSLPLPSAPNGATMENIEKYMQDLYKMSTSNSHGPATLNKAKDIIRKLDLQIQL